MERVLFLIKAREFGGLEIVLLDWLSLIDYSNTSVVLSCYGTDSLAEKLAAKRLPVESVKLSVPEGQPFWKALPKWLGLLSFVRPHKIVFLEGIVGEFGLVPVFASWWSTPSNVFLFEANWGRSTAPPPVPRGSQKVRHRFLPGIGWYRCKETITQRLRGALARHTFVVSQQVKNNLQAHFGYPARRTSVLYHGVDVERFRPSLAQGAEYRRAHGIPEDATVIVSHGRLAPRKRVDRILEAFKLLSPEYPDLWLLLTSYGPFKEEVERIVAGSDAYRRVKVVGFQEDPSLILKASDIYVLASDDEGFGIALVEAMSTGLVCVATNGPGPSDILVNGENGILVQATGQEVLAGLRRALDLDREERARLVKRARETVERRFEIVAAIQHALDAMQIPRRQAGQP